MMEKSEYINLIPLSASGDCTVPVLSTNPKIARTVMPAEADRPFISLVANVCGENVTPSARSPIPKVPYSTQSGANMNIKMVVRSKPMLRTRSKSRKRL